MEVPASVMKTIVPIPQIVIEKGDVKIHIPPGTGSGELRAVMEWLGAAV